MVLTVHEHYKISLFMTAFQISVTKSSPPPYNTAGHPSNNYAFLLYALQSFHADTSLNENTLPLESIAHFPVLLHRIRRNSFSSEQLT